MVNRNEADIDAFIAGAGLVIPEAIPAEPVEAMRPLDIGREIALGGLQVPLEPITRYLLNLRRAAITGKPGLIFERGKTLPVLTPIQVRIPPREVVVTEPVTRIVRVPRHQVLTEVGRWYLADKPWKLEEPVEIRVTEPRQVMRQIPERVETRYIGEMRKIPPRLRVVLPKVTVPPVTPVPRGWRGVIARAPAYGVGGFGVGAGLQAVEEAIKGTPVQEAIVPVAGAGLSTGLGALGTGALVSLAPTFLAPPATVLGAYALTDRLIDLYNLYQTQRALQQQRVRDEAIRRLYERIRR